MILVTSLSDSRQIHVVYAKLAAPRLHVIVRGVPNPFFDPGSWWHTREGWKQFFYAWTGLLEAWIR